ncbi:delta(14)-sterol reductase TM7SF2 isoform X4 [Cavia porcellus]|uniref:delta(14)-sterol reductase TM7SF2 isoform X4 n=1 Tax=Cavia porcellus TaxID=10141 RepID=UPI002FDF8DBA
MSRGRGHGDKSLAVQPSLWTGSSPACIGPCFFDRLSSNPSKPETMASPQGLQAPQEFGGPLGAAALMLLLPATTLHLLLAVRSGPARLLGPPAHLPGLSELWSPRVLLLLLTWLGLQAALYLLPARKVAEGLELKDKSRLRYPINGFQALMLTVLLVGLGVSGGLPLGALAEMLLPLASVATLTTFIFSVLLYMKAQVTPTSGLAPRGNSGNLLYDFFMGRELNPRIGSFDFKYFFELRPGLIGWVLINLALLLREAELRGSPSLAMWLVNGFQLLYVGDALWYELLVTTSSVGPIPRKTLSERILPIPVWLGHPTCSPTSTSSTSSCCWCTERLETSCTACRSTAGPGMHTASVCPTASCPTSTEQGPGSQDTWGLQACTPPCPELDQAHRRGVGDHCPPLHKCPEPIAHFSLTLGTLRY